MRAKTTSLASLAVLSAMALAAPAWAAATPKESLVVISKSDHTLAIVDPVSFEVVARMPVGADPHEVVVTPDGKLAYVSNMGGIHDHEIDVLDLVEQKALSPIDTGPLTGTHGLAIKNGKLWFTAQGAKSLGRIDIPTGKIDWIMGTGLNWTHMLVMSGDGKTIYATNIGAGSVSVFENTLVDAPTAAMGRPRPGAKPELDWVHTQIPTADGNEGIDLSPDGQEVWTASPVTGQIFVIDTAAKAIKKVIDAKIFGANRLKFTHDGKRVLVSNIRNGDVLVYDAKSMTEAAHLSAGTGASGILIAPDDAYAFVACTPDNYVAVIDLKTLSITKHVDAGPRPDGLGWAVR